MSLTQEGEKLYLASKKMLEAAEAGLDAVSGNTEQPSGRLSISIASILGRSGLMDAVASFSVLYPKVKLNIQFSDKRAELIQDGFDMAIRIGTLQDSSLKAKKLFNFERKLVASPSFISGKRKPLKLNDLEEWPWIGLEMLSSTRTFKNTSGKKKSLKFQASIIVDSVDAACQLALAGAGVASPPDFLVQEHLRSGKLVELLPAWKMDPLNVYAVWPQNISNTNLASKFRHELLKLKKNTNAE
jgi:DNA-binding transcriptional LysR family regulator